MLPTNFGGGRSRLTLSVCVVFRQSRRSEPPMLTVDDSVKAELAQALSNRYVPDNRTLNLSQFNMDPCEYPAPLSPYRLQRAASPNDVHLPSPS